jgi:hypothetical protein
MAEEEEWGNDCCVLRNYIRKTFARAMYCLLTGENQPFLCRRIEKSGLTVVAFNTGLCDSGLDDILCLGVLQTNETGNTTLDWCASFHEWSVPGRILSKNWIRNVPQRVTYYNDFFELFFDPRIEVMDNVSSMLKEDHHTMQELGKITGVGDDIALTSFVTGAIHKAIKRARSNLRVAIPQFWDRVSVPKIQLLLPLYLTASEATPKLALILERHTAQGHEGTPSSPDHFRYRISGMLGADWAYNNARLIGRIDSEWLKPPPRETPPT